MDSNKGCLSIILFNILLGGYCTWYSVLCVFGKEIGMGWCFLIGFFFGEITIPFAFICLILTAAGIPTPFIK
jgi:hypothetical protein